MVGIADGVAGLCEEGRDRTRFPLEIKAGRGECYNALGPTHFASFF
jgi:hypothetical protein